MFSYKSRSVVGRQRRLWSRSFRPKEDVFLGLRRSACSQQKRAAANIIISALVGSRRRISFPVCQCACLLALDAGDSLRRCASSIKMYSATRTQILQGDRAPLSLLYAGFFASYTNKQHLAFISRERRPFGSLKTGNCASYQPNPGSYAPFPFSAPTLSGLASHFISINNLAQKLNFCCVFSNSEPIRTRCHSRSICVETNHRRKKTQQQLLTVIFNPWQEWEI